MHKIWVVMRREFLEKVRARWFIISTVLGPVLMISIVALPILLGSRGSRSRSIVVLDASSTAAGPRVAQALSDSAHLKARAVTCDPGRLEAVADSMTGQLGAAHLDGLLILTDSTLATGQAEYRGTNVASLSDIALLSRRLEDAVVSERLSRAGVDPSVVHAAQLRVNVKTLKVVNGKITTESGGSSFALAYAMWLVLYMTILIYGIQLMGSVVEEKSNRIVEVLVSSLRPFELMAGKILGIGSVGLFQLAIWGGSAALLFAQQARIASMMGAGPNAGGLSVNVTPLTIAMFLTYFLLGYFLYAAMLAAVAAMTNSETEARQAAQPVIMLLVVPTVMVVGILNDPSGSAAFWLSVIPFTSPIGMPVRWAAAPVPPVQVLLSIGILAATVVAVTWVAARIYRVGILMYGKRPTLKELVRWVRTA